MGSSIYESYACSVYDARANIRRLKDRFTVFDCLGEPPAEGEPGNWAPWLVPVEADVSARNPAIAYHRNAGNIGQAEASERARDVEVQKYNTAIESLQHNLPQLRELENTGESFCAVGGSAGKFRYIVDEGAKKYYWMEQRGLTGLAEEGFDLESYTTHFLGPKHIGLVENQTDAVRIQTNNVVLRSIEILDERGHDNVAHRDGVQLIPPNLMDGDKVLTDRMAGSIISDIQVDHCTIDAPNAELQGIFSSDGFCRNLTISNNKIKTAAGHFISIAGALDGCKISENVLQQASSNLPQIKLYPGRLGGNMADDGIIYILSFDADSEYYYQPVERFGNQYVGLNQQVLPDQFSDERKQIPNTHASNALGLRNFNYKRYVETYSQWTVADYKANDPIGFRRLQAWLVLRIEEYETGARIEFDENNHPILSEPTEEQQTRVINILRSAQWLLNEDTEDFLSTRIADLQSMPIRSFIIKRLAVKEGDIVLSPLNSGDIERRTAQLKWFLDADLPSIDYDEDSPAVPPPNAPQKLEKNYGELEILATPVDMIQGQMITFSVNESDYLQPGDQASYYWTTKGHTGTTSELEIDTSEWEEGEYNVRATIYVRPASGGSIRQIPGSALFSITAADKPKAEKPVRAYGDLQDYIQVNHARLKSGEKLVASLQQDMLEDAQKNATLRFYWKATDYAASQDTSYEVDTTGFEPGEQLIRVTMHRTDVATKESEQFSGIAVVEILACAETEKVV